MGYNKTLTLELKNEIIQYWNTHSPEETFTKYSNIRRETIRNWCDKERIKKKKEKYSIWKIQNKETISEYNSRYFQNNKEKLTQSQKEWLSNNPEYYEQWRKNNPEYSQEHYKKNKQTYIKQNKQYYKDNYFECLNKQKEYVKNNRFIINQKRNERYKNDFNFKMSIALRGSIRTALRNSFNKHKKNSSSMDLLGCDLETFIQHIRGLYQPGMTDENYGKWHLDHIKPCSMFDLSNPEHQKKCFHYTNLQPLWGKDNIKKSDSLTAAYSIPECIKEYENITIQKGSITAPPQQNKNVLTFQPHFYEKENELWKDNAIREYIINNRIKYLGKQAIDLTNRELLRGFKISGKYIGFSHFSPYWFKYFIEKHNIQSVYDPCGGWGHRLLGAHNLKQYIYNDLDSRTVDGINKIIQLHNITNTKVYNMDSSKFTPEESYESVFICPPYYNVEVYNNKPFESKEKYIEWWKETVIYSTKNKNIKYFGFVINHTYKDLLTTILEQVLSTFTKISEEQIITKTSHLSTYKQSNKKEYLIVYKNNSD